MTEVERLLQRQAAWQKGRAQLTWPEKIRIAEQMRESLRRWRIQAPSASGVVSGDPSETAPDLPKIR